MLVSDLLWALVGGTVVGFLGTSLASGEREVPLWRTILAGVGGVLLGNVVYTSIWSATTPGLDWWRHGWQVAFAVLLVGALVALTGRRR